jgi:hypothetical protein
MKKKKENDKTQEESLAEDPYLKLGYGLICYRSMMENLILGFFILTCIMAPTLEIYKRNAAVDMYVSDSWYKYSLGNLGYSSVECAIVPQKLQNIALQCPYGNIGKIVDNGYGINAINLDTLDFCLAQPATSKNVKSNDNYECSRRLNSKFINEYFN